MIVRTLIGPANEEYLQLIAVTVQIGTIHYEKKCSKMKVVPKKENERDVLFWQNSWGQISSVLT